jgi:hypothetical protein
VQDIKLERVRGEKSRWIARVTYADATQAQKAQKALTGLTFVMISSFFSPALVVGRKFNGRAVVCSFG